MMEVETPFKDLVALCHRLQATSSRLEKRRLIGEFLRRLASGEVAPAVLLITGRIFPEARSEALNVGWATLQRALAGPRQATLLQRDLSILEVQRAFQMVAEVSGRDSVAQRRRLLATLLGQADEGEQDILLRNIFGEMRIGVNEGVMAEAIADAAGVPQDLVREALMFSGDLGRVASVALTGGRGGLEAIKLQLFRPVKPMLAEMAEDVAEALQEHGGASAFEYKFDGARIQIHRRREEVKIFSRRLSDVTESLPEVVAVAKAFRPESFLVEGEVVAVDHRGRVQPFQDLMRRFRRVHGVDEAMRDLPLRLHLFDLLYLEGQTLIGRPYRDRWSLLEANFPAEGLAKRLITADVQEAASFLQEALAVGHEGLMAKDPSAPYTPGKRGKRWFKIKKAEFLDVIITAAEWGHGRRRGWLSNYHLAVGDAEGKLYMVGKTFKGLTDAEFRWMTEKLVSLKVSEDRHAVYVKPEVVVEVAYSDVQRSPHYDSGFALRFARIKRIREDKGPADIDTLERLRILYGRQTGRVEGPP
jgi:DNA ligase-1